MGLRQQIKPRLQDWVMRMMDDLRPETVAAAEGEVLEVGFGTGRNLPLYSSAVKSVTGLDPLVTDGIASIERRIARAPFPVSRTALGADGELPFDAGRFDTVITTWTLCSIPDAPTALAEMRRVLKPNGRFLFIEHGRAERVSTAVWQDRLNPIWRKFTDGCNINRSMDRLVEDSGFSLITLDRFRGPGPSLLGQMYRGVATRA